MKLIVSSSSLKKAMQVANKVISKNSALSILECFLCKTTVRGGRSFLHINSSDLENSISVTIQCEAKEEFRFLIHSDELNFIVKADEQPLTIEYNDKISKVNIYTETENVSSGGEDKVKDYPLIPNYTRHELFYTEQSFLEEVKTSLKYAENNKRFGNPKYQGVIVETTYDSVTLCGTDAHVLRVTKLEASPAFELKFVMNPAFCKLLSSFKHTEKLLVSTMTNEDATYTVLEFETMGMSVTIIGKNSSCQPVDYRRIMPDSWATTVKLNKKDLIKRIERAMLYTNQINFDCIFSINGNISLKAKDLDLKKEYNSDFDYDSKDGNDLVICFNLSLLKKVLADLKTEKISFNFNMPCDAAAIIEPDSNTIILVMPIMMKY